MNKTLFYILSLFIFVIGIGFFFHSSIFASSEHSHAAVCPPAGPEAARCHARVIVDEHGKPQTSTTPTGYGPMQFLGAYNLGTGSASHAQTIAIVDAYDHPNIKSDLDTYDSAMKLPAFPLCASGVTTGCFQKMDQNGGTNYPAGNSGWDLEISLDVEIAHAICQNCKILLVEANSSSFSDLLTAVDTAKANANIISNSYGSSGEFSSETSYDSHFTAGKVYTFSSGDNGYGTSYPAASQYVTAVGGTTLNVNADNSYGTESAWNGSGSGCSKYESKPVWQKDAGCSRRTIADVSADADPNTGAAVYDSVPYNGQSGWFQVGGTSLSSPLIAAVFALNGVIDPSFPYAHPSSLHDVTTGKNGHCRPTYLCTAGVGFDGPTGLGTPNGFGAF